MDNLRSKYRLLTIVSLIILGITISLIYSFALNRIEIVYKDNVVNSTVEAKKTFLKDTVNNVIGSIEWKQAEQISYYGHIAEDITKILKNLYEDDQMFFLDLGTDLFNNNKDFSSYIIESSTGKILYSSSKNTDENSFLSVKDIEAIKEAAPVFSKLDYSKYRIIFYITKEKIDEKVKSQMHDEINKYRFSNDAYIWVNEVIDYNGGDNYAIRRIHPNLKDTEGSYLSTNMTDVAGNRPYLTELEGVKKDGELFFNYFFKKKNSEVISEKITYAKLYKEYDWIIAMGVHYDDVKELVDQMRAQKSRSVTYIMLAVAAITALLIFLVLIFINHLEKWYFNKSRMAHIEEVNRDTLTGAYNRKGADGYLKSAFLNYKTTNQNTAIIMFDIDDFKKINDECGHNTGDNVLRQIAELIDRHTRSTDYLCRWGGDEFIIICQSLKEDDAYLFADKLLGVVNELEYDCQNETSKRKVTISIGVSYFIEADTDYSDAINRSDKALYRSKQEGKNRASFEF